MSNGGSDRKLTTVGTYMALILLVAWLVLLTVMAFHTSASEMEWARWGSVLGSLEAVVFAAAGALFGTTVQKQRVQDANQRAEDAVAASKRNEKAVTIGLMLAKGVKDRAAALANVNSPEKIREFNKPVELDGHLLSLANELLES